jgi:hypothetical protein
MRPTAKQPLTSGKKQPPPSSEPCPQNAPLPSKPSVVSLLSHRFRRPLLRLLSSSLISRAVSLCASLTFSKDAANKSPENEFSCSCAQRAPLPSRPSAVTPPPPTDSERWPQTVDYPPLSSIAPRASLLRSPSQRTQPIKTQKANSLAHALDVPHCQADPQQWRATPPPRQQALAVSAASCGQRVSNSE